MVVRFLVVGCGSIGCRHLRNLNALGFRDVGVVEPNGRRRDFVESNFHVGGCFRSLQEALDSGVFDVGLIATPPAYHVPIALDLAEVGMDLFIEKPLSHSMEDVDRLVSLKEELGLVVSVGYNFRFVSSMREMYSAVSSGLLGRVFHIRAGFGQYLPDWRRDSDYTECYTAHSELGGGILLDGSHEIDYVMWLAGGRVERSFGEVDRLSGLSCDVEDCADIMLLFSNDVRAVIHLDMFDRGYTRVCRVVGEKASREVVFGLGDSRVARSYVDEVRHFLGCVKHRSEPDSNLYTARDTLEVVLGVKEGLK